VRFRVGDAVLAVFPCGVTIDIGTVCAATAADAVWWPLLPIPARATSAGTRSASSDGTAFKNTCSGESALLSVMSAAVNVDVELEPNGVGDGLGETDCSSDMAFVSSRISTGDELFGSSVSGYGCDAFIDGVGTTLGWWAVAGGTKGLSLESSPDDLLFRGVSSVTGLEFCGVLGGAGNEWLVFGSIILVALGVAWSCFSGVAVGSSVDRSLASCNVLDRQFSGFDATSFIRVCFTGDGSKSSRWQSSFSG